MNNYYLHIKPDERNNKDVDVWANRIVDKLDGISCSLYLIMVILLAIFIALTV